MAQTEIYTVFCAIVGENISFPIEIASSETVGILKDRIKEKKPNRFASVDADELALYRVNISGSKAAREKELDKLARDFGQRIELDPLDELTEIYPIAPPTKTIHIIVLPPNSDKELPNLRQQAASDLHAKAWGKPWPQSEDIISKTEICRDESGSVDDDDDDMEDDDDMDNALADKLKVPPEFKYCYFEKIQDLKSALGASPDQDFGDVLVVREEYESLRKVLEDGVKHYRSIVVTGHPGIGKSTFLFYLLLYRLEKKLPTAVQLGAVYYLIFDEQGAAVHPVSFEDRRLEKCWALTDSNDEVSQPCGAFKTLAERVILASSPKPERWKEWIKQAGGRWVISDLPSVPEIAAIAKERRKRQILLEEQPLYDPSSTHSLVRKWGPSTRNILRSMRCDALGDVDPIEKYAIGAVVRICNNSSNLIDESLGERMPQSEGSSVIFLRRAPDKCPLDGRVKLGEGQIFIPTAHLRAIFEEQRRKRSNRESLNLFYAFSTHALTRTAAGWGHEKGVHDRLGMGGVNLRIFRGPAEKRMQPSTLILHGTLAGLKEAGTNDSFYWMPSVVNFPGVDGVLGDIDGNVYTIQATIAGKHTSPEQGIKKVWEQFRPEIRTSRTWHFVIITDKIHTANKYAEEMPEKYMVGLARVQVWVCVL